MIWSIDPSFSRRISRCENFGDHSPSSIDSLARCCTMLLLRFGRGGRSLLSCFFCLCFVPVLVCGIRRFARDVEVGPWRMWPGKIVGGTSRPMSSFRFCCCCCWRWWWRRGETTVIAWCSAESRVQDHVTGSKTAHERYLHFSRKLLVNQQKKIRQIWFKKVKI